MNREPNVLGINRTQDASICLIKAANKIYSIQKERLTRQKHHWGQVGDLSQVYLAGFPILNEPIDLVVECYSSDPEINNLSDYEQEIDRVLRFHNRPIKLRISHHLSHLYSTFFISPFDESAVMIIDCAGSPKSHFTESVIGIENIPDHWVEVSSFYHCMKPQIICLSKQTWDADWTKPIGLGCFYFLLTRTIFHGEGNEGKVMGLAPYGDSKLLKLPPLIIEREKVLIPPAWLDIFKDRNRFRYFTDGFGSFAECAHLAAAGQSCFEEALLQLADWMHQETGSENLCFSGGTALNCVANGRLLRESPFKRIFVPPSPHDGGTALGCALYGLIEHLGVFKTLHWIDDFLGPEPLATNITDSLLPGEDDELIIEKPPDLIERMVDLLVSGKVISLFQGRSESGPRALGHRSILADPRHPGIKSWINQHVKGRELFRPLAPAVLLESAPKFFDIDCPVPFMQFAATVRPEYREIIPAVTHVDGTARLQTVSKEEDLFFYSLIEAFGHRTGIPVLINTSFNTKGEPIVETQSEAIACLKMTAMHALAIPPLLIQKRTKIEI